MKIVLISRFFYPLLSPRSFRTTELAKEFVRKGHDVTVYAVLGDTDYSDFIRKTGVKVKPINMCLSTSNSDGKCRYNIVDKILYHSLHYLAEYPDIEFVWKVPRVIKLEDNIDLLITIACPHTIHWGAALARKYQCETFPKKWISDCGDPYMGNSVHRHPFYFNYIENFWIQMTDYISIPIEEARMAYSSYAQNKICIIPQGFNFDEVRLAKKESENPFPHFAYAGSIYPGYRDPALFLEYLLNLDVDFLFTVYTNNPVYFSKYKDKLGHKLDVRSYIPREELIYELSRQDFLVNFCNANKVQSPSKLIDYLLSERPIINISNEFEEQNIFEQFMIRDYSSRYKEIDVEQFNIRNVANAFLEL